MPAAGLGPVVLDIGGDVGALVIGAPAELDGAELEICPAGRRATQPDEGAGWWAGRWRGEHGPGHDHPHPAGPAWPHVAVLPRPGGTTHAAVFPGLRAGRYEVWLRQGDGPRPGIVATVRGGQVTALEWPRGG
jgi:hypothetical protein